MERVYGVNQFFVKRVLGAVVKLILVKFTDDDLFAGAYGTRERIIELLGDRFKVRKFVTSGKMNINAC